MKKIAKIFLCLLICILSSCASSKVEKQENLQTVETANSSKKIKPIKYNEQKYQQAYQNRDYQTCLGMLLHKTKRKADIRDNLDLGMLYFLTGDYAQASAIFEKADAQMYDSITKSVTRTIAKTVGNENAKEYTGNVYEYLLVNTMNSLCYYLQGDLNSAVNQLTKLSDLKLPEYRRLYGEVIIGDEMDPSAKEEYKSSLKSLKSYSIDSSVFSSAAPKKPTEKDVYKESALARYLSLILRQADGDKSQIDSDFMVLKSLIKDLDSDDSKIPTGQGRINVLALGGLIGKQIEKELYFPSKSTFFYVPTGNSSYRLLPVQFKFVYPFYEKKSTVTGIDVIVNEIGSKKAVLIENFNTNLEKSVALRASKEYSASMIRSISKKVSALVAGIASIHASYIGMQKLARSKVAYTLAYASFVGLCESTKVGLSAIDLTETADIRQGDFFPETVNAAGFTVPAGHYTGKVVYRFSDGTVSEKKFETDVKEGKPSLVVSSCIK